MIGEDEQRGECGGDGEERDGQVTKEGDGAMKV